MFARFEEELHEEELSFKDVHASATPLCHRDVVIGGLPLRHCVSFNERPALGFAYFDAKSSVIKTEVTSLHSEVAPSGQRSPVVALFAARIGWYKLFANRPYWVLVYLASSTHVRQLLSLPKNTGRLAFCPFLTGRVRSTPKGNFPYRYSADQP